MNLHHVGLVVRNLEASGKLYSQQLGMSSLGPAVRDDIQQVRVQFWKDSESHVSLELIEPLGDDSPVASLLTKGGGFAHLCFAVKDIELTIREAIGKGAILIQKAVPAPAFDLRRIAFLYYREIGVVELVEAVNDDVSK